MKYHTTPAPDEAEIEAMVGGVNDFFDAMRKGEEASVTLEWVGPKTKIHSEWREAELIALLIDIEHCRDALEFRPDLVKRLRAFKAALRIGAREVEAFRDAEAT